MNQRKLLIDTDTRHTTSSGLQHSESFTSLAPFVEIIKIEHFSFLRWLVNFDTHCMSKLKVEFNYSTIASTIQLFNYGTSTIKLLNYSTSTIQLFNFNYSPIIAEVQ